MPSKNCESNEGDYWPSISKVPSITSITINEIGPFTSDPDLVQETSSGYDDFRQTIKQLQSDVDDLKLRVFAARKEMKEVLEKTAITSLVSHIETLIDQQLTNHITSNYDPDYVPTLSSQEDDGDEEDDSQSSLVESSDFNDDSYEDELSTNDYATKSDLIDCKKSKANCREKYQPQSSTNRQLDMKGDANSMIINNRKNFRRESIREYHFHIHEN